MNIADLPQDLFEYHIFNNLYSHCNLINHYIRFVDVNIVDFDFEIRHVCQTIKQICFYNNKSLFEFYTFCSYLNLNGILFYAMCKNCIEFNYFNTS